MVACHTSCVVAVSSTSARLARCTAISTSWSGLVFSSGGLCLRKSALRCTGGTSQIFQSLGLGCSSPEPCQGDVETYFSVFGKIYFQSFSIVLEAKGCHGE